MSITLSDLKRELKPWILSLVTGGGGGAFAPINAEYLVLTNSGILTADRTLTLGNHLAGVDAGANSTYTLRVDISTTLDMNGYGLTDVDAIQFDLTPATASPAEGLLYWDTDDGTLNLGMPGGNVNLQLGQEMIIRAKNESGGPIANGQLVYISGGTGNRPLISLAQANSATTADTTIGMATETIANNQTGYITTRGYVREVNTLAYAPGTTLYLSPTTAGGYTDTEPIAPLHSVRIGQVIRQSATEGVIYVNVRVGWHLYELHDANYNPLAVASGDLLRWNGTIWTNSSPAAAGLAQGAGTLTVATANDATIANHTHAITSSSNPGAAASILASDSSGYLQLTGLGLGTAVTTERLRANLTSGGAGYNTARLSMTINGNHSTSAALRAEVTLAVTSNQSGANMPRGIYTQVTAAAAAATTNTVSNVLARLVQSNGTITNWHGLSVLTPSLTGGTLTNAYGLYIESISGATTLNYALYTNAGLVRLGDVISQVVSDAATSAPTTLLTLDHNTSGTPVGNDTTPPGFGSSLLWRLKSSTTNDQAAGLMTVAWQTADHATRAAYMALGVNYAATVREGLRLTATAAGSYATLGGGVRVATTTKSADYTATSADYAIVFDATATLTLPAATGSGQSYHIYNEGAAGVVVTIDPAGAETLKGELTQTLLPGDDLIIRDYAAGRWC